MGPVRDEMPAWIGVLTDEMGQGSPPKSRGEASSDFDQRTSVQRWGQKTVCKAQLGVLNGTWVEVAEADAQECATYCGCVVDWCSLHISALFCGCQIDFHACTIYHICHYCCAHSCGLSVMESFHEANLNHVSYCSFWISHISCRNFCHGPCH